MHRPSRKENPHVKVVVIGAGVIGLSVATELARQGARVTVVEQDAPGTGTSATSYAWVNSNNKEPREYYELNLAGLEAHHRLAQTAGGQWLRTGGHIEVATDTAHRHELQQRVSRLQDLGYQAELITPQAARQLAPDLLVSDTAGPIAYFAREAYCYPQLYLAHLLNTASDLGVHMSIGTPVKALEVENQRPVVRLADGTAIRCDQVVTCAGRWTDTVLAQAGITLPMATFEHAGDVTVGYLAVTNPLPVSLTRLITTSHLNVHPDGAGRLMLQALDLDATADPRHTPKTDSAVAEEMLDRLAGILRHTQTATITELRVGRRAIPADGLTVAGPVPSLPWLYSVATHSGVTLAPLLGELVAKEISTGVIQDQLTPFRPERLLSAHVAKGPDAPRRPGEQ
ncbi:NAD(P)/FAD-dependent oxidoreductase [Streptomyces sp. NPDC091280]|uniref:NAD(P)/FAD-dependent oxidoreductase n=1 Tax=Streptomyces sp. NPDC091280 TaxID=3365984 RepID=UPI0038171396